MALAPQHIMRRKYPIHYPKSISFAFKLFDVKVLLIMCRLIRRCLPHPMILNGSDLSGFLENFTMEVLKTGDATSKKTSKAVF